MRAFSFPAAALRVKCGTMRRILFILLPALAHAATVELPSLELDGRTYEKCSIALVDPLTARITHANGISSLPADKLTPELLARIGYEPAKAAAARAAAVEAKRKRAEAARVAAIPWSRFRVQENHEAGLVVGIYEWVSRTTPGVSSGMSRVGGGGRAVAPSSYKVEELSDRYAWIPHVPATRNLAIDTDFYARAKPAGNYRADQATVIPSFTVEAFSANKPADLPPTTAPKKSP